MFFQYLVNEVCFICKGPDSQVPHDLCVPMPTGIMQWRPTFDILDVYFGELVPQHSNPLFRSLCCRIVKRCPAENVCRWYGVMLQVFCKTHSIIIFKGRLFYHCRAIHFGYFGGQMPGLILGSPSFATSELHFIVYIPEAFNQMRQSSRVDGRFAVTEHPTMPPEPQVCISCCHDAIGFSFFYSL